MQQSDRRIAITREVGEDFGQCALTYLERVPIDLDRARAQHAAYCRGLESLGIEVVSLAPLPGAPDAVFVEDPAIVLADLAVITRPALPSRRAECASIESELLTHRRVVRIEAPGHLEGGDVLVVGRSLYVGRSVRSDGEGIEQLRQALQPRGYIVIEVEVAGCLHLKTACCSLDPGTLLANKSWLSVEAWQAFELIEVPADEPFGANVVVVNSKVLLPAEHPRTADLLATRGFEIVAVELSELMKAESGVTCSSLIFDASVPPS